MNFEDQLRVALRRQDPSPEFAARVMNRVRPEKRRPRFRLVWASGAVAAAIALTFATTAGYQRRQEERAGQQAVMALRIAAEKLNVARSNVLKHDGNPGRTE